jgi:GR25 family glycosyltransferase involved in LPS biosynthesis
MNFIAYILSIKNSERREHVKKLTSKLLKLGFQNVEIIDAFYWKEMNVLTILNNLKIELNINHNVSQSQIACFLTHLKCWEIISLKENNPNNIHIILEDDMDISEDMSIESLKKVYGSINQNIYDSIFLYKHPEQTSNISNLIIHNEYLYKHYFQWGLCAYSINQQFALELYTSTKSITNPVDIYIQNEFFKKNKKDRIFYTVKNYFNNLGFLGGYYDYGEFRFKSHIWN